jgi:hypothetical protein
VKAAPEGVAMFIRPDWRDPEPYKELLGPGSLHFIAMDFLRRNPEYQQDLGYFRSIGGYEAHGANSEEYFHFRIWLEVKWGLVLPRDTDGWNFMDAPFLNLAWDQPESFKSVGPDGVTGPLVMMPFDLSMPLEVLKAEFAYQVLRLRSEGIKNGTVIPRKSRVLKPRVYLEQLRILDAVAAGATVREIGDVLEPNAANAPDERQRDKRIKAAHTAALKMQEGGYRALL